MYNEATAQNPNWSAITVVVAIYLGGLLLTACGLSYYLARQRSTWEQFDGGYSSQLLGWPIALMVYGVVWLLRLFAWLGTPRPPKAPKAPKVTTKCPDCQKRMEEPKPAEGTYRS